jgi:hypothetical protein
MDVRGFIDLPVLIDLPIMNKHAGNYCHISEPAVLKIITQLTEYVNIQCRVMA